MKAGTQSHIKTKRLQRMLGLRLYEACGLLELLWLTTAQATPAGDIGKLDNLDIACMLDWQGDPDELVGALVGSGYVSEHPTHRLVIHDWEEHCPRYVRANVAKSGRGFASEEQSTGSPPVDSVESTTVGTIDSVESTTDGTVEASSCGRALPSQAKPSLAKPSQEHSCSSADERECDETATSGDSAEKNGKHKPVYTTQFVRWWGVYPVRVGKRSAAAAYDRAITRIRADRDVGRDDAHEILLLITETFAQSAAGTAGKYTPHATTWLNDGRYDDDQAEWHRPRGDTRNARKINRSQSYDPSREGGEM
jgi:hypothetical protein